MWIIPSQLLKCAPDMAALDLDSKTSLASECEPSHIVSLRGSLKPISSVKWKKDSWMSHLYGTILKPSHTSRFTDWWTSSLRDTLVSHLVLLESEQEKKTQDISGLGSQMELELCDLGSASSRTSRDTSASDSERSSANWKALVTLRRGEYSQRVKSVRLTNASGSSSWPTIRASEYKDVGPIGSKSHDHMLGKGYLCAVVTQDAHGQAAPVNPSTDGSRQESWLTPRANEPEGYPNFVARNADRGEHCHGSLGSQVKSWATPRTGATDNSRPNNKGGIPLGDQARRAEQWSTPRLGGEEKAETRLARGKDIGLHGQVGAMTNSAKLNPRWVETLMGLPIGWTMPSCMSPLTIAPTNCDCLETESSLPPQQKPI